MGAAVLAEDGVTICTAGEADTLRVFSPHAGGRVLRATAFPKDAPAIGAPTPTSAPTPAPAAVPACRLSACVQLRGLDLLCVGGDTGQLHVYSVGRGPTPTPTPTSKPLPLPLILTRTRTRWVTAASCRASQRTVARSRASPTCALRAAYSRAALTPPCFSGASPPPAWYPHRYARSGRTPQPCSAAAADRRWRRDRRWARAARVMARWRFGTRARARRACGAPRRTRTPARGWASSTAGGW